MIKTLRTLQINLFFVIAIKQLSQDKKKTAHKFNKVAEFH